MINGSASKAGCDEFGSIGQKPLTCRSPMGGDVIGDLESSEPRLLRWMLANCSKEICNPLTTTSGSRNMAVTFAGVSC